MPGTVNPEPTAGKFTVPSSEPSSSVQSGHDIKLPPKFISLYPQTSSTLRFYQRSLFG